MLALINTDLSDSAFLRGLGEPPPENRIQHLSGDAYQTNPPNPWVLRVTDDESAFFFCHPSTGEMRWQPISGTASSVTEAGTPMPQLPGKAPAAFLQGARQDNGRHFAAAPFAALGNTGANAAAAAPPKVPRDAPPRLQAEMREALALQLHLDRGDTAMAELSEAHETMAAQLRGLISVVTDLDSSTVSGTTIVDRWVESFDRFLPSVRTLLYASGVLPVTEDEMDDLLDSSSDYILATTQVDIRSQRRLTRMSSISSGSRRRSSSLSVHAPRTVALPANAMLQCLARLIITSRKLIHLYHLEAQWDSTDTRDRTVQERHNLSVRLSQQKGQMRDDATELLRTACELSAELDQYRFRVDSARSSNLGWPRTILPHFGTLAPPAGIDANSLSGGSAAGWRGNGFVLPSANEMACLRAEAMGTFINPFDLTQQTQVLLARGHANLRRRPNQELSSDIAKALQPHEDDMRGKVAHLRSLAKAKEPETESSCDCFLEKTQALLYRVGTYLSLLEDVDLAVGLDYDGPSTGGILEPPSGNVARAREQVCRFVQAKQNLYDGANQVFVCVQDFLSCDGPMMIAESTDELISLLDGLDASMIEIDDALSQLLEVHEEQQPAPLELPGVPGARSKVYGSVDWTAPQSTFMLNTRNPRDSGFLPSAPPSAFDARGWIGDTDSRFGRAPSFPAGRAPSSASSSVTLPDHAGSMTNSVEERGSSRTSQPEGRTFSKWSRRGARLPVSLLTSASKFPGRKSVSSAPPTPINSGELSLPPSRSTSSQGRVANQRVGEPRTTSRTERLRKLFTDDSSQQAPLSPDSETPPPDRNRASATPSFTPSVDDVSHIELSSAPPAPTALPGPKAPEEPVPWFLESDTCPEEITHGPDGTVKAGTLMALIQRFTMHDNYDPSFNNTLLLTYRSFTNTDDLLNMLFERFRIPMPEGLSEDDKTLWATKKQRPIQLRVQNALKLWLETYSWDEADEQALDKVATFVQQDMSGLAQKQLIRALERRKEDGVQCGWNSRKTWSVNTSNAPPPILPNKTLKSIKFLDIDPLEMARQLTIRESDAFGRIRPQECLDRNWAKPDGQKHSPTIKEIVATGNRVTGWVVESILLQADTRTRAQWLKHFIHIADRCSKLHNFASMTAIVSGLNSAAIYRLRATWRLVNVKTMDIFKALNNLLLNTKNFAQYRDMIHNLDPPCVPFLGVYLTDLTFIDEGNMNLLRPNQFINFNKHRMTAEVVKEIGTYQSTPYVLTPVQGIQRFIKDSLVEVHSDEELYQQSLQLEPRERDESEKITKMLIENGFW